MISPYKDIFYVKCLSGIIYRMRDMCNHIDYSDERYLRCFHDDRDSWGHGTRELLAMFPHGTVTKVFKPLK